jgi:hypothetical protein
MIHTTECTRMIIKRKNRIVNAFIVLDFINLFFAGMLAGIEFVIHYGVAGPTEVLDVRSQLQLRQALVLKLRVLVPAFFVPTALSAIAITVLGHGTAGFWFQCIGLLGILLWTMIRIVGTVPINSATLEWNLDAPPKDWQAQVEHAERFHIFGTWAAVIAFACFLLSVALNVAVH